MNTIYTRRSVRQFTDEQVSDENIKQILHAAMQAPSSMNQQAWHFYVIQNREILDKLSTMSPYATSLKSCQTAILAAVVKEEIKKDIFIPQDLAGACQNIMLEAANLNLGSVRLGVVPLEERIEFVGKTVKTADNMIPFALIPIGHPVNEDANKYIDRYQENKITFVK